MDAFAVEPEPVGLEIAGPAPEDLPREGDPDGIVRRQVDRYGPFATRPQSLPAQIQLPQRIRRDLANRASDTDDDRDRRSLPREQAAMRRDQQQERQGGSRDPHARLRRGTRWKC